MLGNWILSVKFVTIVLHDGFSHLYTARHIVGWGVFSARWMEMVMSTRSSCCSVRRNTPCTIEKECLSIKLAVEVFCVGKTFTYHPNGPSVITMAQLINYLIHHPVEPPAILLILCCIYHYL